VLKGVGQPSELGGQGKSPITAEAEVDTKGTTDYADCTDYWGDRKNNADSGGLLTTNSHELTRNGRRGPAKTTAGKHREKEVSGYQEGGRLATKGTKEKRA